MGRPRKANITLAERLARLKEAGISTSSEPTSKEVESSKLEDRIRAILAIVKDKPRKSTDMHYLIMYDISEDKVRTQISKYLEQQGCLRIQKSVFFLRSDHQHFEAIKSTLVEVNDYYENQDSIILVPVNASDVRSMKIIGKNVNLAVLVDKPNTLFF